ncbi:MAG TPA: 50S ribosomal protein L24 [Firmicutes bacterium]|nr:50S ribosomal protein L24 [Bacillota bacterium]
MQPKVHVRKGDMVLVIAGRDRGKKGKVLRVFPAKGTVLVEGANMVKRHMRPTPELQQGGIISREAPLHASNVQLVCSRCDKPTRLGKKLLADGRSVRYCRKCGETLDK